jgi:hypothetical protein
MLTPLVPAGFTKLLLAFVPSQGRKRPVLTCTNQQFMRAEISPHTYYIG